MSSLVNQPTGDACPEPSAAARVEQLYARHSLLVRSVCRSLLRDAVEAEDALQQTFLSAQRALLNGSSPRDDAAWLVTIARHESFARIRARMREPLPTDAEAEAVGPDAHAVAVQRHEVSELRGALAELPAPQREAILLREVRGFSYGEVASALAVTPSAVESLLFRARRSLQTRLRSSLTLFPPAGFVRALAARIGGGAAVPTAKLIAVGAGAAIITGGAVTGPRILGLGQARHGRQAASAPAVHRSTHARTAFVLPDPAGRARLTIGRVKNDAPARPATRDHSSGVDVALRPERSDQSEASSRGGSDGGGDSSTTSGGGDSSTTAEGGSGSSTDGGAKGSGDTQTTSSGDTNTTTDSSSQSAETQTVTETTTTTPSTDGSGG